MRVGFKALAALSVCLATYSSASAQDYPSRPIRMIVGFSAGGGSDFVARALADTLGKKLGQSVVVENKPGAGGVLATRGVARGTPDGYTLIMGSAAAFVVNPYMMKDVGYDPVEDFTPVASVSRFQYALMGRKGLKVSSVQELIDYARKNPKELTIGSAGVGSNTHLVAVSFMDKAGIELVHVPYKGTAGATNDLQGGNIDLLFDSVPTVKGPIMAGRVKAFATTGSAREPELPNIPTLSEAGVPGFQASNWFAIFGPKGMDAAIVKKLNTAINDSLSDPELQARFKTSGNIPLPGSSSDLSELVKKESAEYRKLIDDTGIRIEE